MNRLEERLSRLEVKAGIVEHDCRPHALVRVIIDPQLGAIGEMRRIVPCHVCGKGERYNTPYVEYDTPRLLEGIPCAAGKIADANAAL